ncbi:MAG: hypothetical protein R3B81_01630 [bacterium]
MRYALRPSTRIFFATVAVAALSLAGCGKDETTNPNPTENQTIPASWGGTWQVTSTPTTTARGGSQSDVTFSQLCAGTPVLDILGDVDPKFGAIDFDCSGDWNDASVNITCSGSGSFSTCTYQVSFSLNATRTGDTFTGTQTFQATFSPDCQTSDISESYDITGVRVANDQFACDTDLADTLPASWAGIWDINVTPQGGRGSVDLLCEGDTVWDAFADGDYSAEIAGGFTDTSAEAFVSTSTLEGSCFTVRTNRFAITRDGDSMTGTQTETIYSVPDPGSPGAECGSPTTTVYDIAGTRISTDTSACSGASAYLPAPRNTRAIFF